MANLSEMTNEQREEHRRKVSVSVGLDPEMQLLEYIWMPNEDGMKSLVLYCRRGAAEILRANRGISVTKLTQGGGEGYVSFTAEGVDKTGRTEVAIGSSSTAGLRGEKLAHAVMTSSTRSLRRLTLQFVGQGLLDESEVVSAQTIDIASAGASLALLAGSPAVMPPPQVVPSAAPGRDITPFVPSGIPVWHIAQVVPSAAPGRDITDVTKVPINDEPAQTIARDYVQADQADLDPVVEKVIEVLEATKKRGRPRKKRNTVALESPGQQIEMPLGHIDGEGKITPFSVPLVGYRCSDCNADLSNYPTSASAHVCIQSISVPPATANEPEQGAAGNGNDSTPALAETLKSANADILESQRTLTPVKKEKTFVGIDSVEKVSAEALQPVTAVIPPLTDAVLRAAEQVPLLNTAAPQVQPLSPEKKKEYYDRLSKYSQNILPKAGGMLPSDGVGGITMKLRLFALRHIGTETTKLSEAQFEDLLGFLDGYVAKNGAPALVEYINKSIGA